MQQIPQVLQKDQHELRSWKGALPLQNVQGKVPFLEEVLHRWTFLVERKTRKAPPTLPVLYCKELKAKG